MASLRGWVAVPATDDGTNTTQTTAITPVGSMADGDLCIMIGLSRATSGTLAISEAGGQTWTTEAQTSGTTNRRRVFWCRFNGTWSANPSVNFNATTCNTLVMIVFIPDTSTNVWVLDQAVSQGTYTAPTTPFTVTITGQTTTFTSVAVAFWTSVDDNTWDSLSGTGWSKASLQAQWRNSSGSDTSITAAYNIQGSAGATNNVAQNQATLGGDAGTYFIGCWYQRTAKAVSDSGTGADTMAGLKAAVGVSDSGAGSDSLASLLAKIPLSDSGAGVDTVTKAEQAIIKSVSDTGAGTDTAALRRKLATISDSGTGADTVARPLTKISISDSGAGVDTIAGLREMGRVVSDSGAGVDTVATQQFIRIPISDAGTGVDTVTRPKVSTTVSDVGSGVDSLAGLRKKLATISDAGTGVDTAALRKKLATISDTGAGVDTVLRFMKGQAVAVSDQGTGVDSLAALKARLSISDLADGVDTVLAGAPTLNKLIHDAGAGVDVVTARGVGRVSDLGVGSDSLVIEMGEYSAQVRPRQLSFDVRRPRAKVVEPRDKDADVLQRRDTP